MAKGFLFMKILQEDKHDNQNSHLAPEGAYAVINILYES